MATRKRIIERCGYLSRTIQTCKENDSCVWFLHPHPFIKRKSIHRKKRHVVKNRTSPHISLSPHPVTPPNLQKQILTLPPRRQSGNPNGTLQAVPIKVHIHISANVQFRHLVSLPPYVQRPHNILFVHDRAPAPAPTLHPALSIHACFGARCCTPRLCAVAAHMRASSAWGARDARWRCRRVSVRAL